MRAPQRGHSSTSIAKTLRSRSAQARRLGPDPADFVRELKRKAGISEGARCEALRFERYRAVEIRAR